MSSDQPQNRWICDREKTLLDSPVMKLIQRDCHSSEDNTRHRFYILRSRHWCNMIPVTEDGHVVLVKQFRLGIDDHTLEIPGGVAEPSEPQPEKTALREMTEETGFTPLPQARVTPLGWTHPNPAIQDNKTFSYVVGPVRKTQDTQLDPGELMETVLVPIEEIEPMILSGKISHALILNAFFFLSLRGKGSLTEELKKYTR